MRVSVSRATTRDEGQGLVELIVALTILAIGIGSLLSLLTSSALSLQRAGQKGTALVLAEKQIELYRSVGYRDVRLDDTLEAAAASDATIPYGTANSADSTIPSASNQLLDTATDTNQCVPAVTGDQNTVPDQCKPYQLVQGPDHRWYEIDTYIHATTVNGGDTVASVAVIVRNGNLSTRPILARSASTFSSVNVANVNGKSIVKLAFTAPKADVANVTVSASSISATLSNTNNASGQINFYVLPPPYTPSSPCGTIPPWVSLGPATVTGNGTYHPSGNYPASGAGPAAGAYYWYASYTGDSQNKKASSICGASSAKMTVQAGKWSPSLSVATTATNGFTNTAISGSTLTAALTSSSGTTTGAITYMVYGPSATAPATCTGGAGWTTIGSVTPNGDGSYNPASGWTPTTVGTYWYYAAFTADATNNSATSLCNSSSMAKTVVTTPPDTFGISNIGSKSAGVAFTIATITAQLYSGGTDTSYTGSKTLTFTGPGASAKGNTPTYPVSVTFTNGVASAVPITLYKAETTTLTATQGLITGTSNSFTVSGGSTAGFSIDAVGSQTAGTPFGVTVRAVDVYGNASTYSGAKSMTWTNPGGGNSPNGDAPVLNASTATTLTFANISGQGVAVATGINLYLATSSGSLKVNETATGYNGQSTNFTVNAAAPNSIAWINCIWPTGSSTTCTGSPFSTKNSGTLQANIAVKDTYGNTAVTASALTINLTSGSTSNYTVAPASVTIGVGGSQSNQLTVTPVGSNPGLTTITAHATSGGYADKTVQVQK
jgi:type II secretory pathway pseudopilin PulG